MIKCCVLDKLVFVKYDWFFTYHDWWIPEVPKVVWVQTKKPYWMPKKVHELLLSHRLKVVLQLSRSTQIQNSMSKKFPMYFNCAANNLWGIKIQPNGNFSPAFDTFSCMMIGSQYTTSCFGARTLPKTYSQEIDWSFDGVKRSESDNKQELLKPCGWQKFRESTSCSIDFLL